MIRTVMSSALILVGAFCALKSFGQAGIQLRSVSRSGSNLSVSFDATQSVTYRLERKIDITNPNWQFISGLDDFVATSTGMAQLTHTGALASNKAFYRVRQTTPCDGGLASNSNVASDYAKAME